MTPAVALALVTTLSLVLLTCPDDFVADLGRFGFCAVFARILAVAYGWPL